MKLKLDKDLSIGQFRDQFSQHFERLSIQLFTQAHKSGEGSPLAEQVEEDRKLGEWLTDTGNESVEVNAKMTVAE